MLRVLFIEDDEAAIKPILRLLKHRNMGVEELVCEFHEFRQNVRSWQPEIIVLDLWVGQPSDGNNEGLSKLQYIWKLQFCPVIVYSAVLDLPEEYKNPFIREIQKGSGSEMRVLEAIHDFRPHVDALKDAEEHIKGSLAFAMRDVAPLAFDTFSEVEQRSDAILRAGRRRLAASMDVYPGEGQVLACWEQYLCPPISKDILLGDILRRIDGDGADPSSFRVVISPSCDLVSSGGREPKVGDILVAKCCSTKKGIELNGWKNIGVKKLVDRLEPILNRGYFGSLVPLPALKNLIPTMMINLRELELIPFCDVGDEDEDKDYHRIASLDSPFRELVSWAYIQVSGRPGVPDRDLESWREEIIDDYMREAQ